MSKQDTWNIILAALIQVRNAHGLEALIHDFPDESLFPTKIKNIVRKDRKLEIAMIGTVCGRIDTNDIRDLGRLFP